MRKLSTFLCFVYVKLYGSLLPNLEQFELSGLFDKCKSLSACIYYTTEEQISHF